MQNIDYQSFVNYAKMRYMAIADGFDVPFDVSVSTMTYCSVQINCLPLPCFI